ncbi:caspase family protein [Planktothrix agardhii]|uniref:caspase family protein n=1 Tax=Planktothrix agardhii TaxID=1160 RepID=UPI002B1F68EF|nr:caspase family protein [Planktothrix agardhii]MEA5561752.1 caspase family protein [Planktothrix agardhii UHCC 0887]
MNNSTPNFHILLIGINFYFPHRLTEGNCYKNLKGCVPDINHVETYLKNTFNLTPDQIIKLTATASDNPEQPQEPPELLPTYENIVNKFKEVTAKAKPQDIVYIHYSGHGGRAKTIYEDIKGFGGLDEALVPCDIGQPNSRYLRDLELAKLLDDMVQKQLAVTVVFDSCHSGGATRDETKEEENIAARGSHFIDMTDRPKDSLVAPPDEFAQISRNIVTNSRSITVADSLFPTPNGYSLIAACRDHELAYEKVFEGTERNGALTYFLLKALRQFGTEISAQELYDRISNFVNNEFKQQTPLLIGETERTFFGTQTVKVSRTAPVMKVDVAKNRVQLRMGQASGIKKGAEFDIFKFRTRDFKDTDQRILSAKVVELGASDCWVEITQLYNLRTINNQLQEGMIDIGFPAYYIGPGVKQIRKVRLLLPDASVQFPGINLLSIPTKIKQIKERVEGHRWIEFCSEEEPDENVDYFVSLNSEGEYWILDTNKQRVKNILFPIKVDEPEAEERLINRLIHVARYYTVLDLDNDDAFAPLNGKLKVELVKSEKKQLKVLNTGNNIPIITEREENIYLKVRNESKQTLNITILILDADLSISTFYLDGVAAEVIEPGQEKNSRKNLTLELPQNYQEALNVIKVFATVNKTTFELLELPALDQDRKGFGTQQPTNSLEKLLAAVVDEDNPTRKVTMAVDASEEWTTEKVEVVLKKS